MITFSDPKLEEIKKYILANRIQRNHGRPEATNEIKKIHVKLTVRGQMINYKRARLAMMYQVI